MLALIENDEVLSSTSRTACIHHLIMKAMAPWPAQKATIFFLLVSQCYGPLDALKATLRESLVIVIIG